MRVRRVAPSDGPLLKAIRLAALADPPDAFGSTLAAESAAGDEAWADRAAAGSGGSSRMTVFAERAHAVVGLAGGYRETDGSSTVELVSMWVSPDARRAGVARALVAAVVDWARETGGSEIALWVTRGNPAIDPPKADYVSVSITECGSERSMSRASSADRSAVTTSLP